MALITIHRRCYSGPPSGAPPTPIKAPEDTQSFSPLTELLPSPLPGRNTPHRVSRPPPSHRDARPPHRRSRPGEPPTELPAFHSSSPAPWSAPVDTEAAGGRSFGEPGAAVHGRSTVDRGSSGPRPRGPGLREFLYENNSLNQHFWQFCKEAPVFLCN
jgi:hypothetical protein